MKTTIFHVWKVSVFGNTPESAGPYTRQTLAALARGRAACMRRQSPARHGAPARHCRVAHRRSRCSWRSGALGLVFLRAHLLPHISSGGRAETPAPCWLPVSGTVNSLYPYATASHHQRRRRRYED